MRQPISCAPCRERKIRCSRNGTPCDTCRKRKCIESCIYPKKPTLSVSGTLGFPSPPSEGSATRGDYCSVLDSNSNATILPVGRQLDVHHFSNSPSEGTVQDIGRSFTGTGSERIVNDTIDVDVGDKLRTTRQGHVLYEPKRSQWQQSLPLKISSSMGLDDPDDSPEVNAFPLAFCNPTITQLIRSLPGPRQRASLKDVYFRVFSPLFHILYDPVFHDEYNTFECNPESVSLSWLALFYTVLSLAVTALDDDDTLLNELCTLHTVDIKSLDTHYRDLAMKCLAADGMIWRHDLRTLQALILMIYGLNHSQNQTSTWVLLGTTYSIALAIGVHVDPDKLNLGLAEGEERRRCWAGLVMLYTINNTALKSLDSRPLPQDVKLPADINDSDLLYGRVQADSDAPTQMTYILFKFHLYELSARISHFVLDTHRSVVELDVYNLEKEIASEREKWNLRYHIDSARQVPLHHQVQVHILHIYSHQLTLLLYRPLVFGPNATSQAKERCIASALEILFTHKTLCEVAVFKPYKWYVLGLGSFYAFHAAVVLAAMLLEPLDDVEYIRKPITDAMERFRSSRWRSSICEKASRALEKLLYVIYKLVSYASTDPFSTLHGRPGLHEHHSTSYNDERTWEYTSLDFLNASELLSPTFWQGP